MFTIRTLVLENVKLYLMSFSQGLLLRAVQETVKVVKAEAKLHNKKVQLIDAVLQRHVIVRK